jgi:copper chaperone CopZ
MKIIRLKIKGLDCPECAIPIEKILSKIDGVEEINFKYSTQEVAIKVAEELNEEKIITVLKNKGYEIIEAREKFRELVTPSKTSTPESNAEAASLAIISAGSTM